MEDAFRTKVQQFRRVGTMLDCSRNAVANLDSLREWIDLTAGLGFTTLMLYTEDTYELAENPYFGYLRGRYSKEDLKEVDAYAASKHMELIPCIQTLAHLRTLKRWPEYAPHFDAEDILLIDDDRVYALIDQIFSTLVYFGLCPCQHNGTYTRNVYPAIPTKKPAQILRFAEDKKEPLFRKVLRKAAQNRVGKGSSPLILPKPFLISFFPTSKNGRKKTRKPLKLLGFSR